MAVEVLQSLSALSLQDRLGQHENYFNALLELVPAKYYLPAEDEEEEVIASKYAFGKRKALDPEVRKDNARKHKRAKLDPEKQKSVNQILLERAKEAGEEESNETANDTDLNGSNTEGMATLKPDSAPSNTSGQTSSGRLSLKEGATVDQIRAKIRERIEEMQAKRKRESEAGGQPAKSSAENGADKDAKKRKRKETKKGISSQPSAKKMKVDSDSIAVNSNRKVVIDEDGAVIFSKFDLGEAARRATSGGSKGATDLSGQLKKLQARKKKLEETEKVDKDKAEEIKNKAEWRKAKLLAEGVKVKDDEKLILKSLKRKQKLKGKSSKEWSERQKKQKEEIADRQRKRTENIKNRIQEKKDRKMGKKPKKVIKKRPGFEGSGLKNSVKKRKDSGGSKPKSSSKGGSNV